MKVRIIRSSDIGRCPKTSLSPEHYRDDGTCRCEAEAAAEVAAAKAAFTAACERLRRY